MDEDANALAQEIAALEAERGGPLDDDPEALAQEIYDLENKKKPWQGVVDFFGGGVERMRHGPLGGLLEASDREVADYHTAQSRGEPLGPMGSKMAGYGLGAMDMVRAGGDYLANQPMTSAGLAAGNPFLGQSLQAMAGMFDNNVIGEHESPREMLQGYASYYPDVAESGYESAPIAAGAMVPGTGGLLKDIALQGGSAGGLDYLMESQKQMDQTGQVDQGSALSKAAMSALAAGAFPIAGHLLGQFGKIFKGADELPTSIPRRDGEPELYGPAVTDWTSEIPYKPTPAEDIPTPPQPDARDMATAQAMRGIDASYNPNEMQVPQAEMPVPPQPSVMDAASMQMLRGVDNSYNPLEMQQPVADIPTPPSPSPQDAASMQMLRGIDASYNPMEMQGAPQAPPAPPKPVPAQGLPTPLLVEKARLDAKIAEWERLQQQPPIPSQVGPSVPADHARVNQPPGDPLAAVDLEHSLTSQPNTYRPFPVEPSQQPAVPPDMLQGNVVEEVPLAQNAPSAGAPGDAPVAGPEPNSIETLKTNPNWKKKAGQNKYVEIDENGQETGRYTTYRTNSSKINIKGEVKPKNNGMKIIPAGEVTKLGTNIEKLEDALYAAKDPEERIALKAQIDAAKAQARATLGAGKPDAKRAVGKFQQGRIKDKIDEDIQLGNWHKRTKEEQNQLREQFKIQAAEEAANEELRNLAKAATGGKKAVEETVLEKLGRYAKEGLEEETGGYPLADLDAAGNNVREAMKSITGALEAIVNPSKIERSVNLDGKMISATENLAHKVGLAIETRRSFDIMKNYKPAVWNHVLRGIAQEALDAHGIKFELSQENLVDRAMRGENPYSMTELKPRQQVFLDNAYKNRQGSIQLLGEEMAVLEARYEGGRESMPSPMKLVYDVLRQTRDALSGYRADPNTTRFTEMTNALGEHMNNYLFRHNLGYDVVNRTDMLTMGAAALGPGNMAKSFTVQQTDKEVAAFLAGFDAKGTMRQYKSDMRAERPNPKGVYDDPFSKAAKGVQKLQDKIPHLSSEDWNFRDALGAAIINKIGVAGLKKMARGQMSREHMVDVLMEGLTGADEVTGAGLMGLNRDIVQRNPHLRWLSQFTSQPMRMANLQRKWITQGPKGISKIAQLAGYLSIVGGSASIPRELDALAEANPETKKMLHAVRNTLDYNIFAPTNIPGKVSDAVGSAISGQPLAVDEYGNMEGGYGRSIREKLRYSAVMPFLSGLQQHVLMEQIDHIFGATQDQEQAEKQIKGAQLGMLSLALGGGGNQASKVRNAYDNWQQGRKKIRVRDEIGLRPGAVKYPIGKGNLPFDALNAMADAVGIGRGRQEEQYVDRVNKVKSGAGY